MMVGPDVMTQEVAQESLNGRGLPITVTSVRMTSHTQTLLMALLLFIIRYKSRVSSVSDIYIYANLKFI